MPGPIGPFIKNDLEHKLVATRRESWRRKRELYVHIKDGRLVGDAEILYGFTGEIGSSQGPRHFRFLSDALAYYTERGVPLDVFNREIAPYIPKPEQVPQI